MKIYHNNFTSYIINNSIPVTRISNNISKSISEKIAIETPLGIRINGKIYTILMVTPTYLEALTTGFLLSEGLSINLIDISIFIFGKTEISNLGPIWWVDITIKSKISILHKNNTKNIKYFNKQTNLYNNISLNKVKNKFNLLKLNSPFIETQTLFNLFAAMKKKQQIFLLTGATHAVALGNASGQLISIAEDISRHNAFDKAIGLAIFSKHNLQQCIAIVSGRLNYQISIKSARIGLPIIASISAPTNLSLNLTNDLGITLTAFIRYPRISIFTYPSRITIKNIPILDIISFS